MSKPFSFTLTPPRPLAGLAGLRPHPLAEVFPPITGEDWTAFAADIATTGVVNPVVLYEGKILDGRNRWRAALEAELTTIPFVELERGDPVSFVISANEKRRHMTTAQRAQVASRLATLGEGRQWLTAPNGAVSQPEAAKLLKVGRRTVQRARAIDAADRRLGDAVLAGRIEQADALRLVKADEKVREQALELARSGDGKAVNALAKKARRAVAEREVGAKAKAMPDRKFAVIYADPPWTWAGGKNRAPDYATMSLDAIKAMKVPAADDAVLFLWATAPTLAQALEVIAAWGFEYRSHCVWKKDRIGTGFWFRSQHEPLLVAVRGDMPAPAHGEQQGSVIEAPVGRHSQKPECFRTMIATLYPTAPKLELFCRGEAAAGWVGWGAEAGSHAA